LKNPGVNRALAESLSAVVTMKVLMSAGILRRLSSI